VNHLPARRLWEIFATIGDTNQRTTVYQINPFYTGGLFQLRRTATDGLIAVQRVQIYGGLTAAFGVNLGALDQAVIARWGGNTAVGVGQLRQPKGIEQFAATFRRKLNLIPPFLIAEWNVSAVGDPGATATMEIWGMFIGPDTPAQS
jgi:hypothetical protein